MIKYRIYSKNRKQFVQSNAYNEKLVIDSNGLVATTFAPFYLIEEVDDQ